jgi:hypothetical protein
VVEGHESIRWSLVPERNGWTSSTRIDARLAAYFVRQAVVSDIVFSSLKIDRLFESRTL